MLGGGRNFPAFGIVNWNEKGDNEMNRFDEQINKLKDTIKLYESFRDLSERTEHITEEEKIRRQIITLRAMIYQVSQLSDAMYLNYEEHWEKTK